MTKKSGIILLAALILLGYGLTACGDDDNCQTACQIAVNCEFAAVGDLVNCVNWCESLGNTDCSENCNGIIGCDAWAACIAVQCVNWPVLIVI